MKNFIGIDLGTTNSAICSYDGSETRIWKSPEQNDVTPSAIHIDRRGYKDFGLKAYDQARRSPDNAAMLFKPFMGAIKPFKFSGAGVTLTPEECSAEVLKTLFGYLPEEVRNDPDTGTVITVPAAFDMMQRDATMEAATMAGIGKVALVQEPVAAVMSVMRTRKADGRFLIYDFGGGTTDIAIAQSIGGRVTLLALGGIQKCGGRDFDRSLVDNVVCPWLLENFDLRADFSESPSYKSLLREVIRSTERAKIELSSREEAVIRLDEMVAGTQDLNGDEIYLDIPLQRDTYDALIAERVNATIDAARDTLSGAGLTLHDLECIVWVGGPTKYKPLRDQVSSELGIRGDMIVDPMTAVAEGASLFAASIDWDSENLALIDLYGQISLPELDATFRYIAHTPTDTSQIGVQLGGQATPGAQFQIDNVDTSWTSERLQLKHGETVEVALTKDGENTFRVSAFDAGGKSLALEQNEIVITKTAATIGVIPAPHTIALEVLRKFGGKPTLIHLVHAGDPLPKQGELEVKAGKELKAGSSDALNFRIWQGDIEDPITDNRFIGTMKIAGRDFPHGVIARGDSLKCTYLVRDSGHLHIAVNIPSIDKIFTSPAYSAEEGKIDYTSVAARTRVADEVNELRKRIDETEKVVDDSRLGQIKQKLEAPAPHEEDAERWLDAHARVWEGKRLLAKVRNERRKEFHQLDLTREVTSFEEVRRDTLPVEVATFDKLIVTAQHALDNDVDGFEEHLDELKRKNFDLHWRQDWFVNKLFRQMESSPPNSGGSSPNSGSSQTDCGDSPPDRGADRKRFMNLVESGSQCLRKGIPLDRADAEVLRTVVFELGNLLYGNTPDDIDINIYRQ